MLFSDAFESATRSLTHGKMRSILTMLGIVIGIASVIILMSIGRSAQNVILNQVESVGSNLIFIIPGGSNNGRLSSPAASQGIVITTLNDQDVTALKREPSVEAVAPEVRGQADVVYGDNDVTESFEGTTANYFAVRNMGLAKGYAFTQNDVDSANHVAVIGSDLATTLFGANVDPVGKDIRLKNVTFRVVGVLVPKGTGVGGVDEDDIVLVPSTVAQQELLGITYYNDLTIEANPSYDLAFVKTRITYVLEHDHNITNPAKDDFTIETQADILSILGSITSILTLFLAAVASISLVVGGIGIMNIMLVAVTERTREIGLRKAVGATDKDILQQFLIESVLLCFFGGLIGIVLGAIVVTGIYFLVTGLSTVAWTFSFPASAVILSLVVSTIAGLGFGVYPARQAAKKNPIDALRYE